VPACAGFYYDWRRCCTNLATSHSHTPLPSRIRPVACGLHYLPKPSHSALRCSHPVLPGIVRWVAAITFHPPNSRFFFTSSSSSSPSSSLRQHITPFVEEHHSPPEAPGPTTPVQRFDPDPVQVYWRTSEQRPPPTDHRPRVNGFTGSSHEEVRRTVSFHPDVLSWPASIHRYRRSGSCSTSPPDTPAKLCLDEETATFSTTFLTSEQYSPAKHDLKTASFYFRILALYR